jgi:diadenosine tetraphosphate (Ap4A) HIT family hydrolase
VSGDCFACAANANSELVPGGVIHETRQWLIDHCVGPLGIGTLIVRPKRHITRVAELDDAEVAELGPLLRTAAKVVDELVKPEQVYVWLFSHAAGIPVHVHYVVQPATREAMDELGDYGPHLTVAMFERDASPDPEQMAAFADRARAAWARA